MDRRILTLLAVIGLAIASTLLPSCRPAVTTIYAQTFPVTVTLQWTQPIGPTVGVPDSYTVFLDGTQIGTPTTTQQSVTFQTGGPHTLTVTATNVYGTSGVGRLDVVVAVPGTPTNLRIGK